jgi:hypothetical protein
MRAVTPDVSRIGRVCVGVYLAAHYAAIAPWAGEIYGRGGVLPDASLNPIALPGAALVDAARSPQAFVAALAVLAVLLALGVASRACAALLWLGGTALFHRNLLTLNPALPFLGLWLLAHVVTGDRRDPAVTRVLWGVTAIAYAFSALTKILSPSWASGEAVPLILAGPLGHAPARAALAALPAWVGGALTYATLAIEASYVPLAFVRRARPYLWLATMLLHAGLLGMVDIADISLGMLAFHATLFEGEWVPRGLLAPPSCSMPPRRSF